MRSTQSIVQGRRWRRKQQNPEAPEFPDRSSGQEDGSGEAGAAPPQRPRHSAWRTILAAVLAICVIAAVGLFCYFGIPKLQAGKQAEPSTEAIRIPDGFSIVTVDSPIASLAVGDVVSICGKAGVIPALRYVEVAQVEPDGVSVLLSDCQLDAYLSASTDVTLALRAKAGKDADSLLQWQASFNDPDVALSFAEELLELAPHQTLDAQVELTVTPEEAARPIQWRSLDESVATVSPDGEITAVAVGETTISASVLGREASLHVVVAVRAEELHISKSEADLLAGHTGGLSVTLMPENVTDPTVHWESSDENVATVEPTGDLTAQVTALSAGTAEITASCGEKKDVCRITVSIPAESLALSKTALSLPVGAQEALVVSVLPEEAAGRPVTWASNHPEIATVSAGGVIKALKKGTAAITATCDGVTVSCAVTVQ